MARVSYALSLIRSSFGVVVSRVFGLVRDVVVAGVFGASTLTDIFFVAFAVPNLFRQFFAEGAISSAFVPFLSDKIKKDGTQAGNIYLTQLIVVHSILIALISFIIIILAPYFVMLFAPGYANNPEIIQVGANMLRIVVPYLLFVSICGLLGGYLNLHGSYFVAYASTAMLNIAMIFGAIAGYYANNNIYMLAIGVFIGGVLQTLVVCIYAIIKGYRLAPLLPFDTTVKETYKLVVPSIAGVGVGQLNFLIGRFIASFLAAGSISWLFYANRLFQFPLGVFSITISMVSLTELSIANSNGNAERFSELIDKAIIALLLLIIPATIGLTGLANEIITLIYSRRAFTEIDAINTASALKMYTLGLLFYSLSSVLTRVYHSRKDIKTPVKYAIVAFFVNLIMNLILMWKMTHAGIALSASIAALVNAALLYRGLEGYSFNIKAKAATIIKIVIASCSMLFAMMIAKHIGLHVLINISICVILYFGLLFAMKVDFRRIFR